MFFNKSKEDKFFSNFYYNGIYYDKGTRIAFADDYIRDRLYNGKEIPKYMTFWYMIIQKDGTQKYHFAPTQIDLDKCYNEGLNPDFLYRFTNNIDINEELTNEIIEEIIDPIYLELIPEIKKTDFDCPAVLVGWAIYVVLMIGSLIFKDFYCLWGLISFYFFRWRKAMLNDDN
ncbi:MAG: hypothetical protein ACI4VQ_04115 [Clostridia bacterium]